MQSPPVRTAIDIAEELFAEAYLGAVEKWTWFVNPGPEGGLFGTIDGLTAREASTPAAPGGRSVAAHVEHLRWSLANANGVARGEPWNEDWSESWRVQTVSQAEWDRLRADIRREFDTLRRALQSKQGMPDDLQMLTGVCSLAPHAAYHLGAIKLIAKIVASDRPEV